MNITNRATGGSGAGRVPFAIIIFLLLMTASPVWAYIGPGAGFGIVTSFLVFLNAIAASLLSALLWPISLIVRMVRRRRRELRRRAKRVIVLGLDGLSPSIAASLMREGEMPNLSGLASDGSFSGMATTCPGISPVAWSSFLTGVNPGRHGIFDFLAPDRKRYLAVLSSVRTGTATHWTGIGRFGFDREKPFVKLLRKSRPFWSHLKRYGLRSTVLRVPITYPPEPLDGHLLSGMCVPDVRGTQGSYTLLCREEPGKTFAGGIWSELRHQDEGWSGSIPGPEDTSGEPATIAIHLRCNGKRGWSLTVGDSNMGIRPGMLTEWVELTFRSGGSRVRAISRFLLTLDGSEPALYCSALHVDPYRPSVPVSHPVTYSKYLSGLQGPFATLGLAEDTWALSNGAISSEVFLQQAWSIFEERRTMFFDALKRNREGLVVCVFDTSDRIQHMFRAEGHGEDSPVRDMYRRMDVLIGETMERLHRDDMLIVMSDHGFTSFHTCVDFNRWLVEKGYMVLEEGVENVDTSFRGVDWSKTSAWSMGLAGILLNLRGREGSGIVDPGEAEALLSEISSTLLELRTDGGDRAISAVYRASEVYSGPYSGDGPDLIVGTAAGFRAGWGCVTGGVGPAVLYPNVKHWNGDHSVDRKLVPGTLACNFRLDTEGATITDMAPTILEALGVKAPAYMEGRSLLPEEDR